MTDPDNPFTIAKNLATHGIPIFIARPALNTDGQWDETGGHGESGYWLPPRWQDTTPDPTIIDTWRPGDALAAVMGHGIDGIDIDPRHNGHTIHAELATAGMTPRSLGQQTTPSGGWHDLVNTLNVASCDNTYPGIDVKAGTNGEGHGFLFIAPTVKLSKDTGEVAPYTWTQPPNLDELDPNDDTGAPFAEHINQTRASRHTQDNTDIPHDAYNDMNATQQAAVKRWLDGAIRGLTEEMATIANLPEGDRDKDGRGWEKATADTANRLGRIARADWNAWDYNDAHTALTKIVPTQIAQAVGLTEKWRTQAGRRTPLPYPATLANGDILMTSAGQPPEHQNQAQVSGQDLPVTTTTITEGEQHSGQIRMAYRLANTYAHKLMHVHGIGWHTYDGTRWIEDNRGAAKRAVLAVLKQALNESFNGDKQLRADVTKCESKSGVEGVLGIAQSLDTFATTVTDLDTDPHLLNTANGTLDLRTMELRQHDPADRLTKVTRAAYHPDVGPAEWATFLENILPDADERNYLGRVVGQALYGRVTEHLFPVLIGTGGNGKGTMYGALEHALGDYVVVIDPSLLMASDRTAPPGPEMMQLMGARLVIGSETSEGRKLDEATMKRLTGGDSLTARRLYKDPITWTPTHQILYVTNHLPTVKGNDPAVWRRMRVIPFDVTVPEADFDTELPDRLMLHADAILAWAVNGYQGWRADGMQEPASVLRATDDYRVDSDAVQRFVSEGCMASPVAVSTTRELYAAWQSWASREGETVLPEKTFAKELDRLGYPAEKTRRGMTRTGLTPFATDELTDGGW